MGKEFLGIGRKKPRKEKHYEFSTDPSTGIRNNKGTYSGQLQKQRKQTYDESNETFESNCTGTLSNFVNMGCCLVLMQFKIAKEGIVATGTAGLRTTLMLRISQFQFNSLFIGRSSITTV